MSTYLGVYYHGYNSKCFNLLLIFFVDIVVVSCHQENIKSLMVYTVDNFMSTLETVDYVKTFKELKLKYEQDKEEKNNRNVYVCKT